jgi:hypothetical protein
MSFSSVIMKVHGIFSMVDHAIQGVMNPSSWTMLTHIWLRINYFFVSSKQSLVFFKLTLITVKVTKRSQVNTLIVRRKMKTVSIMVKYSR